GLARSHDFSTVTASGSVLGTPAYMAPEQIQEAAPSASSDQYALGVMTYEFLTGQPPFMAETAIALVMMHIGDEPQPPSSRRPDVSPALDAVVLKMLAKEPAERYPDVSAALAALREALLE
ncbi:MAG: protein kinase, partial [Candidatus Eremiobacteraeota bacterium]|nr:protein kinase [Candidatus Eremiobacteraeota bacterium]